MDICIDVGKYRYNYRVAGLIKKGDEILVHHAFKFNHVTLPGGRVKSGEESITALKREIQEEIGEETEYISPVAIVENIFREEGIDYHEILIVHELKFLDENAYKRKIYPVEPHKKDKLEFLWYNIQKEKENEYEFLPRKLFDVLKENNNEFVHIINDER